jgi:hypothetical protein
MVWNYLDLTQTLFGHRNKQLAFLVDCLGQAALRPPLGTIWLPPPHAARDLLVSVSDPIGKGPEGLDIIPPDVIDRVLDRKRLPTSRRTPTAPPSPAQAPVATSPHPDAPVPTPLPRNSGN